LTSIGCLEGSQCSFESDWLQSDGPDR